MMVFDCFVTSSAIFTHKDPMPKTSLPTIGDIAKRANVSLATVDRVLNQRSGVRQSTAKAVLKAAVEVGYIQREDIFKSLQPPPYHVVFLLPAGTNSYLQLLGNTVQKLAMAPIAENIKIHCIFVESLNPKILANALMKHGQKADGIAFMAIDHPRIHEAVSQLCDAGKAIVTIVSDIPKSRRIAYVGLDNRAVGRTAAHFLGRLLKPSEGKIALITASRTYKTHEERELGFWALMEEEFPQYDIIGVREGHDNRDENYRHTITLLDDYPDLIGVYNVGGSSDGIARALREKGREKQVLFIGHGLTQDTRRFLIEETMDMVLTQSPNIIISNALRIFENIANNQQPFTRVPNLSLEIIVRENLPSN